MTYEGPERRNEAVTEDRVQLMIQTAVSTALQAHEQHLMAHMDKQFAALKQTFADAFPGGDPHGHRIAHEQMIRTASWWDKAKGDAFSKFASMGIWAVAVFVAIALWEAAKNALKR